MANDLVAGAHWLGTRVTPPPARRNRHIRQRRPPRSGAAYAVPLARYPGHQQHQHQCYRDPRYPPAATMSLLSKKKTPQEQVRAATVAVVAAATDAADPLSAPFLPAILAILAVVVVVVATITTAAIAIIGGIPPLCPMPLSPLSPSTAARVEAEAARGGAHVGPPAALCVACTSAHRRTAHADTAAAIERQQKDVTKSLKEAAAKGDKQVCKVLAVELVRSRRAVSKIYAAKAQLNSVSLAMQQQMGACRVRCAGRSVRR